MIIFSVFTEDNLLTVPEKIRNDVSSIQPETNFTAMSEDKTAQ